MFLQYLKVILAIAIVVLALVSINAAEGLYEDKYQKQPVGDAL